MRKGKVGLIRIQLMLLWSHLYHLSVLSIPLQLISLTHHPTQHLFREYISKKIGTHASTFKSILSDPTSNPSKSSTSSSAPNPKDESIKSTSQSFSNLTMYFELLALPSSSASQSSTSKRRNNLRLSIDKERGSLEEILLLIRKLREGIVASHREVDEFVIDGEY